MRTFATLALALVLAACGESQDAPATDAPTTTATSAAATASPTPVATKPDLATCPRYPAAERVDMTRNEKLAVPEPFADLIVADNERFAIATLSGATHCLDVRWINQIDNPRLFGDGRFLSFDWTGYETFGHILIDRTGKGTTVETGATPIPSRTGKRLAAVDLSESGFGAFNAFGVWEVETGALRELGKTAEGLPAGDWRVERWQGEDCVALSLLPIERQSGDARAAVAAKRDPWFAAADSKWVPAPGTCGGA
jgi:hypothetical protein